MLVAALEAAVTDMNKAATAAGVEPDGPLGSWMMSLQLAMRCNAAIAEQSERRMKNRIDGLVDGAKEERAAMKAATQHCEAQTLRLIAAGETLRRRADNQMAQTIESMADQVAHRMRERMVIVEERHNRFVLWRTGVLIAVVLLTAAGGGFGFRAYVDRRATTMLERCMTSAVLDPTSNLFYCPYGRSPPPH